MMNLKGLPGRMMSFRHTPAVVVSVFAFLVYCKTLAPTVSFIDSGELASVVYTLGIAHPTGYPLFTLLGWVFSRFPWPADVIVRLNLMAAFFCAAGIYVFYHLSRLVLEVGTPRRSEGQEPLSIYASAGASVLLAFSETYWSQAVAVEVYSLHLFLLSVVCYAFLRATYPVSDGRGEVWWYFFGFTLGLSFANHMTTILLAPGFLFLYFAQQGSTRKSWMRVFRIAVPFLSALSVYLYLPFRAAQSPLLNWGDPTSLERFFWHFSGKQYRVWIFSSTEAAGRQLEYFITSLPAEFALVGLILAIPGFIILWRADRKLAAGLILLFIGCVLYSINYDIHDIDSYFLLAYFVVALLAGPGLYGLGGWLIRSMSWRPVLAGILLLVLGLAPLAYHYRNVDESDNFLVEDYTMNVFESLGPNALIFSYQWDYWVSASIYFQLVKGWRPDVVVIDKELLRRSWYLKELKYRYPSLIAGSRSEVDAFLKELHKFEHELPYNGGVIQSRYVEMIASLINRNVASRPVYVTAEIEPEFTRGYQRVPEGLAFRLYADTLFHPFAPPVFTFRRYGRKGRLEDQVPRLYADAFAARGEYYWSHGYPGESERALKTALFYDPAFRGVQRIPPKPRN